MSDNEIAAIFVAGIVAGAIAIGIIAIAIFNSSNICW